MIHPPVDAAFFTPAPGGAPAGADAPLLVVSALVPYKGVERAIRVANRMGLPLRVVGIGPERARLERLALPGVRVERWLDDETLREAYRYCRALDQAHEEDFGIAPLEAMACGRPVVALRRGGASEVVGEGTGILFDREDDDALEAAIAELGRRAWDPARLRRHAQEFDRARYRERMESLLSEAWDAFEGREGDPWAVERRLAGARAEPAPALL